MCVAYTAEASPDTNLDGAAFSVNEIRDAESLKSCFSLPEPPPKVSPSHVENINGARFIATQVEGVGSGHSLEGYVYRAFHHGKCYELDIRIVTENGTGYDPGTLKNFDVEQVRNSLKIALNSFTFLK